MFSYLCTACGKKHLAEGEFRDNFVRECLRCGAAFQVTREITQPVHAPTVGAGTAVPQTAPWPGETAPALARGAAAARPGAKAHITGAPLPHFPFAPDEPGAGVVPPQASEGAAASEQVQTAAGRPADKRRGLLELANEADHLVELRAGPDEEDEPVASGPKKKPKTTKQEPTKDRSAGKKSAKRDEGEGETTSRRGLYLILAGVLVLVIGGASAAYLLSGGDQAPPGKKLAKGPGPAGKQQPPRPGDPKGADKASGKPKATEGKGPQIKGTEKGTERPPTPGKALVPTLAVAAPALSAELENDPEATDRKYGGKVLAVNGLFGSRITPGKDKDKGGLVVSFKVAGRPVRCELKRYLGEPGRAGLPLSVVGLYDKDGLLREGEVVPDQATADFTHRDKEIELAGVVKGVRLPVTGGGAFPVVLLEGDVLSRVSVECVFPRDEVENLRRLSRRALVTIRGRCGPRRHDQKLNTYSVRLDDCEFITSTGPRGGARRVDVRAFLREYEQDLRDNFLPDFGKEPVVPGTLTVEGLAKEAEADPKAMAAKYRNKRLTVKGHLVSGGTQTVVLDSGRTGLAFQVSCTLDPDAPGVSEGRKEYTLTGVCADAGQSMRLVYCRELGAAKEVQRLTAEYLPHRKDRALGYDLAIYPQSGLVVRPTLFRQMWYERDGGLTSTLITHRLNLGTKTIFDTNHSRDWVKRATKGAVQGPTLTRVVGPDFIELTQKTLPTGQVEKTPSKVLLPVIKLGAKVGDSWTWKGQTKTHTFTLERFEDFKGKPCAVIKEVIGTDLDLAKTEILRKFVLGVGLLERREVYFPKPKEEKRVSDQRLVEYDEEGGARVK